MANKFISGIEHVGHWLVEGAEDVVEVVPKFITVCEDAKTQAPEVVAEFKTLLADCVELKSLIAAIALAIASGATNIGADLGVVSQLEASAKTFIKIGQDTQTLYETLSSDISKDVAATA